MRKRLFLLVLALSTMGAASSPPPGAPPAALGLAVNLSADATTSEQNLALQQVRATGVTLFALPLSWPAAEPAPGRYRIAELVRTARLLRQSGAVLHLDLPLVAGTSREVPADLAATAFDDPKLSLRLGRLLDALGPALLDFSFISFGSGADAYFAQKPDELAAFRRLFDGAIGFLGKKAPHLRGGVTTWTPTESPAPAIAAALHQKSPVLFYVYSPFERGASFRHRPPDAIDRDWRQLLETAGNRLIAFSEVSYSSAAANGSSPAKQAEFVRRFRRLVAAADGRRLLFARYVPWRDPPAEPLPAGLSPGAAARSAFEANRGLQTSSGAAKPAWREWALAAKVRPRALRSSP